VAFDDAKNDAQLADAVLWSLYNGHEDWLLGLIREDLTNSGPGRVACGLTIAGFLDASTKAEHLWKQTIDMLSLSGWPLEVLVAARLAYQRNIDARYWLEQYLTASDCDRAFDYLNLFAERTDSRSHIWMGSIVEAYRQNVPRALLEHMNAKIDEMQSSRKKVEDARKKTLFFTAIGGSISPWL
jgi:hypothetical protein